MAQKYENYKVAICVSIYDSVLPITYSNHLSVISKWNKEICELILFVVGYVNTADARNGMVESAREYKCTHFLFLDGCHIIPDNLLPFLLDANLDIISGLICKQLPPFEQDCGMQTSTGLYDSLSLPQDGKIHKVDLCAFGCSLVKGDVFSKIGRPYFVDSSHDLGHMRIRYNKSHTINFQEEARGNGAEIGVHTGVVVGHLGRPVTIAPDKDDPNGHGRITLT